MGPVAERAVLGLLASAPGDFFVRFYFYIERGFARILSRVSAVAKGLFFRFAAAAPMISTGFHIHNVRGILFGAHVCSPC